MDKKLKISLITSIVCALLIVIGVSYSFFEYKEEGQNINLASGDISINFTNGVNYIEIPGAYPVSDKVGKIYPYYADFTVTATTLDHDIEYQIQIVPTTDTTIDLNYIKVYLTDQNDEPILNPTLYTSLEDADYNTTGKIISSGWFESSESLNYRLRVYIDETYIKNVQETFGFKVYLFARNGEAPPPGYLGSTSTSSFAWDTVITDQKTNITTINFSLMKQSEIDTGYGSASIKYDATDTSQNSSDVLVWLEDDPDNSGKYIMNVASTNTIVFPTISSQMFSNFTSLTDINFDNADTSKIYNMSFMFSGCSALTTLDVSRFDTSNIAIMLYLFDGCTSLTNIDLSSWDVSNAFNIYAMFRNCTNLTSIDLSNWNLTKVTQLLEMFSGCTSLTTANLSGIKSTAITNFHSMFLNCTSLTSVNLSNAQLSTTSNVNLYKMFSGCSKLTSIDIRNMEFTKVNGYYYMFYSVPTNAKIIVLNSTQKAWITSKFSTLTNIVTVS